MADFSALKTSIQNYIKQNGNEEITGNLLQQILLSMVTTLGDSAINDLVTALNAEIANRGNADTTLQGNINSEAAARGNADTELGGRITTLQGVVNGIKANVENGYVYAGIATPSTTPVSGKVFYLALTAGTYTNFGATVVPQGINILKYNGSAWSLDSFLGLDDAPTQGSNNLVKSGGVLDSIIKNGSAFDLSAYNNGTTYADLSAALTALNVLPAAYKKGGMSMKYVQTSDNKYIQYRLMSDTFNTTPANWQGVDDEPTAGSENLVKSGGIPPLIAGKPNFEKGYRYDVSGTKIADSDWIASERIYVGDLASVVYSGGFFDGDSANLIAYNSSDIKIGRSRSYDEAVTYNIPQGTEYIVASFYLPNILECGIFDANGNIVWKPSAHLLISINTENIDQLNQDLSIVNNNFGKINEETTLSTTVQGIGAINFSTGKVVTTASNYSYTNTVAIVGGTILKINSYTQSGYALVARKNGDGTYTPLLAGSGRDTVIFVVPNDGNYVFSYITSEGLAIKAYSNSLSLKIGTKVDVADYKENQGTVVKSLCQKGLILANGVRINEAFDNFFYSKYIFATAGVKIQGVKFQVASGSSFIGVFFYDSQLNLVGTLTQPTRGTYDVELTDTNIPSDAKYFRFQIDTIDNSDKSIINYSLPDVDSMHKDIEAIDCPEVFIRKTNDNLKLNTCLYPEGFIKNASLYAELEGGKELPVLSAGDKNLLLSAIDGLSKNVSVKVTQIDASTKMNKTAFVMCIGESTTVAARPNPFTGSYEKFWGWVSAMNFFNLCDKSDFNNNNVIKTIGHQGNRNLQFTYNNETLTNRAFVVGASGRPSYWLMYYPTYGKLGTDTTRLNSETLWYFLGLATKTPYNQTGYNTTVEEYTGSNEQIALITNTAAGFYKVDSSEALWNVIRDHYDNGGTITGSYTGSAAQKEALQSWAESVYLNPENPFFDITKVRSNSLPSDVAFSMDKYLERYRTLDDAGNRLTGSAGQTVTGLDGNTYTIGTLVENTEDWDVCTPTHVIFNIGINDSEFNFVDNAIASIKKLVGLTSVPTAWFICRYSGASKPSSWTAEAMPSKFSGNKFNADMLAELKTWFDSQNNKYILPIYQIQYPCSSDVDTISRDLVTGQEKVVSGSVVHTGYFGYKSIGLQVLSWLYSIL